MVCVQSRQHRLSVPYAYDSSFCVPHRTPLIQAHCTFDTSPLTPRRSAAGSSAAKRQQEQDIYSSFAEESESYTNNQNNASGGEYSQYVEGEFGDHNAIQAYTQGEEYGDSYAVQEYTGLDGYEEQQY